MQERGRLIRKGAPPCWPVSGSSWCSARPLVCFRNSGVRGDLRGVEVSREGPGGDAGGRSRPWGYCPSLGPAGHFREQEVPWSLGSPVLCGVGVGGVRRLTICQMSGRRELSASPRRPAWPLLSQAVGGALSASLSPASRGHISPILPGAIGPRPHSRPGAHGDAGPSLQWTPRQNGHHPPCHRRSGPL